MSFNSTNLIHQLRTDFEQLLTLVTGPEAHTATLDQMERSLFRQVLRLGLKLRQLFLATRVAAESHAPPVGPDQTRVPYHSQKPLDYFSIFGKLTFARAYFYTPGQAGGCPLEAALSLPARCYSDLLLESAEVLSVDGAYDKVWKSCRACWTCACPSGPSKRVSLNTVRWWTPSTRHRPPCRSTKKGRSWSCRPTAKASRWGVAKRPTCAPAHPGPGPGTWAKCGGAKATKRPGKRGDRDCRVHDCALSAPPARRGQRLVQEGPA